MTKRIVIKSALTICTVGSLLWLPFSCGDNTSEEEAPTQSTGSEASAPGALAIFLPGSLPEGATVEVLEATPAAEFTALTDAPAASKAYDVKAIDKDKKAIAEALKPFTLAIELIAPAGASLKEQDKKVDNLCVVAKYGDNLFVWRKGGFTVAEGYGKIEVSTAKFGLYMVIYCGTLDMKGFTLVAGEKVEASVGTAYVCNTVDSLVDGYAGICSENPPIEKNLQQQKDACGMANGVFTEGGSCSTAARSGECRYSATVQGFEVKHSKSYYSAKLTTEQAKTHCAEQIRATYAPMGYAVSFFGADGVEVAMPVALLGYCNDIPSVVGRVCHKVYTSTSTLAGYCAGLDGTEATACPPDLSGDFVARCRQGQGTSQDYDLYMYADYQGALNTESGCEQSDGTFSPTWE